MRRHPAVLALAVAAAAGFVVLVVAAVGSRTPGGCAGGTPLPNLPAQLRSIGGFDQPVQSSDTRALQDLALQAASALHGDLAVTAAGDPVGADQPERVAVGPQRMVEHGDEREGPGSRSRRGRLRRVRR